MRPNPKNLVPLLALALFLAATVWAVSFNRLPPADFSFCNGDEIKTVDPAVVTGSPEGRIIRGLFEGLCNQDPKTLEPTPGVAERWDISDDKLTYTFHLRRNALWSDGTPVTAHDFAYSFLRFLHPGTAAEYAYEMWYVVGAEQYTKHQVRPGDLVEVELADVEDGAQTFPRGTVVRGELVRIEEPPGPLPAEERRVYQVRIEGEVRRFQKQGTDGEPYRWVLPDWDRTVGIEVLDDRTLRIVLRHPVPYFLDLMAFYPMYPVQRQCVEAHGFPAWTKPENLVSNGPYRLVTRRIRDRVRMVKSDTYWNRDEIHIRSIDVLPVKSETTMLNLYITGQADWIPQVPKSVIPELLKRPDFRPEPYLATYYYRFNVTRPALKDRRVRRALSLALDRREIVERVTRAGEQPAHSFVPVELAEHVAYTPARCGGFDPEEARRLLAEAGYPGGMDFPSISILFNDSEAHKAVAELVQAQWRRNLGIGVRLEKLEWGSYQSRTRQMEYDVARAGWIGDYVDPFTFLKMWVTDGGNNQTGWANPEYDRLLEEAQHQADMAERMQMFQQAEQLLMDELPIVPIYYYVTTSMVRPYVEGFYPNLQDVHPYQGMRINLREKERILAEEGLR